MALITRSARRSGVASTRCMPSRTRPCSRIRLAQHGCGNQSDAVGNRCLWRVARSGALRFCQLGRLANDWGVELTESDVDQAADIAKKSPTGRRTMDEHELGFFTEENSVAVVTGRNKNAKHERLKQVMEVITRKLHEAVKEIEPTQEEWMEAITFLTRTGQLCNEWRQEFILLSDVLGVSMLVDAINNRKPTGASQSTVLGPFYVANAPELPMGANICLDGKGEDMVIHGRILDTEGSPVANALLDVWQANDEGFYDVQQKGIQPDFNLRGVFRTGADGHYWFRAAKPRFYPIPNDGTVGTLLQTLGRHPHRPAHLHFILKADGFNTLTTHIFDKDDAYINSDAVFGVKESLLAEFKWVTDPSASEGLGFAGPFWDVEYNFILASDRADSAFE